MRTSGARELAGDLEAVHARQHHVEHDQVVRAALGAGQPLGPVVDHVDAVAGLERPLDHPRHAGIVLDQQDVHCSMQDDTPVTVEQAWNRLGRRPVGPRRQIRKSRTMAAAQDASGMGTLSHGGRGVTPRPPFCVPARAAGPGRTAHSCIAV